MVLLHEVAELTSFAVATDSSTDPQVVYGRHEDHVAAREGDVGRDPRCTLRADGVLGDLHEDPLGTLAQILNGRVAMPGAPPRRGLRDGGIGIVVDVEVGLAAFIGELGPRCLRV